MEAPPTPAILLDTNVFVSAVQSVPRVTDSLRLIVHLLAADVRLVGNELLAEEYLRYAQLLPSPTATALAASILGTLEIIRVEERFVLACTPYFGGKKRKDCVHAATCLQLGASLVSNDHDFDAVDRAGVIRRMTISEAVRRWLPGRRSDRRPRGKASLGAGRGLRPDARRQGSARDRAGLRLRVRVGSLGRTGRRHAEPRDRRGDAEGVAEVEVHDAAREGPGEGHLDGRPGRDDEGHIERDRRGDPAVRDPIREGLDRRGPDRDPGVRRRVVRHRHEADELAGRTARMDDVLDAREDREVRVVEHVHGHAQEAGGGQGRAQQEDAEDRQRQQVSLETPRPSGPTEKRVTRLLRRKRPRRSEDYLLGKWIGRIQIYPGV